MAQASKTTAEKIEAFIEAAERAQGPAQRAMRKIAAVARGPQISAEAREALATWLLYRDWPSTSRYTQQQRYEYRVMAAAILNGEAWAIRKAWPEGASDIADTRSA